MNTSISILHGITDTFVSGSLQRISWGYDLYLEYYYSLAKTQS